MKNILIHQKVDMALDEDFPTNMKEGVEKKTKNGLQLHRALSYKQCLMENTRSWNNKMGQIEQVL